MMATRWTRSGVLSRRGLAMLVLGILFGLVVLSVWSCRSAGSRTSGVLEPRDAAERLPVEPASEADVRDEPLMRVRIRADAQEILLSSPGAWVVAPVGATTGDVVPGPARVVAGRDAVQVVGSDGKVRGFQPGAHVYAARYTVSGRVDAVGVEGVSYPGTLRLVPSGGDRFDVISVVPIESYLPGVLSGELFPHWHRSAFAVQAVAARSFALTRREAARRAGRHYDVTDSTRDQVYRGQTTLPVAHDAVRATRGVVLVEDGRLAPAFYSSTCGGRPALAEDVWPDPASPRIASASIDAAGIGSTRSGRAPLSGLTRETLCEAAPLYRWETLRDAGSLRRRVVEAAGARGIESAAGFGGLRSIEPVAWNGAERPTVYELVDVSGRSFRMTGEQLRTACNASVEGLRDVPRSARVHSNDLAFEVGRRTVTIRGRGHGHGVGLCQFCAQGMAVRGDHWRRMLAAFYPDAEVRRVY
ncbi:MAG: SpoIID/LytB domain-containing protein [Planctomycetota bacterium]